MRHFNFNNSTKNAISRLSFAFSIIACILFAGTVWGQAKVTVGSDISATGSMVLEVSGVDNASVSATPVERTSPNGKQLYCAYDIDITKDGREWQPEPEQPAMVSMEGTNFADGQMLDIYHEGANGLEFVATVASENGKITFPAHSFSVYIVAEAADYNRLKVVFHQADGNEVTIWVKKLDLDTYQGAGNFNRIVYNPGMGVAPDGVSCMGWTTNVYYTDEDIPDEMTFDEIRDSIASRLTAGVEDGDDLHFYTMLFKSYSVIYLAEHVVAHTDLILFRSDADMPHTENYTVNAGYTPADNTHHFDGWLVKDTLSVGSHIEGFTGTDADYERNYPNDTTIRISGDVVFDVNVSEGFWLIYHENGKGATYKAADFVRSGEVTQTPSLTMSRNGYTFDEWWTGAPSEEGQTPTGSQFVFGRPLTATTHVYAKWTPRTTAPYSVIIWKQNINGDGYDFEEIITLNGSVNSAINTVSRNGNGNSAYATVRQDNGTTISKQYPGFHLDRFDQNVTIVTEGNAVLNVYYNRKESTLHFQIYDYIYTESTGDYDNYPEKYGLVNGAMARVYWKRGEFRTTENNNGPVYRGTVYTRSYNQSWHDIKTITRLYEQNIGDNFPIVGTNGQTYNNGERWDPQSTSGSNDVIVYLDIMLPNDETYHLNTESRPLKTMNWYVEALSGESGVAAPNTLYNYDNRSITAPSGLRYVLYRSIGARYNGATIEDFIDILGYERIGSDGQRDNNGFYIYSTTSDGTINFYYRRKVYDINYMDGAYYDGNGGQLTEGITSRGSLGIVSDVAYGTNIASYNNETYATVPDGYVFEGWYSDETCTQPYNFTTMPSASITVFARWRQIQYRVFLHPNVEASDRSLDWGSDEQEMNFRITYGGSISAPTGIRSEYNFVGWYTDAAFTHPFNEDAVVLNETTVTTPYDKTIDMTDVMDKYGNGATINKDAVGNNGGDRFWITKKYELFAQWRAKLRGANGINVEYVADADDHAENLPIDSYLYNDNVKVTAAHACSYSDPDKEFSHWVLQHWNGSEFEDIPTSPRIFPGAAFRVRKSDSKRVIWQWYNPRNPAEIYDGSFDPNSEEAPSADYPEFRATYTLRLRAEYITKEKPDHTYIEWFRNDGTVEQIDGESTSTPTLGINEAVQPPVPDERTGYNFVGWYRSEDGTGEPVANCDPELLYYNSSDGAFYKESSFTNVANYVAADNYSPRQYLYAIWEPIVDFTLPPVCQGAPVELPLETKYNVDLSADGWSWTASSGTVAGRIFTPSEGESVTLTFNPASSTCAPSTSFPMTLKTPNISNASDYNFIWRGGTVSHLTDWNTTSNWFVYNNGDYSIATVMPTRESNIFIGAADCVTSNWPSQTAEASAKDITIADGASLTVPTGKTLKIYGNLDNIGTLSSATDGTVEFCGTSARAANQTISHDITLGNVVFYNQGGDIVPSGNVTINGAATFKDGVVKHDVTFGNNASVADAVSMTYNSFVEGKVTKTGSASGFTFPTGKDNVLGKIEALSEAYNVSVQYFRNSTGFSLEEYPRWWNINDMCSDNRPQLDHVSNVEYWDVATTLGIEAVLTVSAADGSAHFNSNTLTHEADDIYGAFWNGSCWENIGGGSQQVSDDPYGTISVAVKIPQTRAAYEKIVTLGSKDHNTVLPIELTSFSATCDGRSSYVMWTTATEKNNDYFSLERSDDAINFVEIARIAGAGNSIEPLSYSYTDYGVYGGDNYYRLVQVDYDGTRTASEIIVTNCVETSEEEPEVVAYPNPFSSDLTVELENFGDRPASIEVYDVLGRLVYVERADAPQNNYQTILHLGDLSKSTYTVRVSTADFVINRKVVKD